MIGKSFSEKKLMDIHSMEKDKQPELMKKCKQPELMEKGERRGME